MRWVKRTFISIFVVALIFVSGRAYINFSDGFSLANVRSSMSYDPRWDVEAIADNEVKKILSQPFSYLGKGCQSYVFESEDGNYVLKFFKFQHLRTDTIWCSIPLPEFLAKKRDESIQRRLAKKERLFKGSVVAYEQIPELTGVVYLHLNPTNHLNCSIEFKDKIGWLHSLPADKTVFILQRKAIPAANFFTKLEKEKSHDAAKSGFHSLLGIYHKSALSGIIDLDPATIQNLGFSNGEAQIIDIGQLSVQADASFDLSKRIENVRSWVSKNTPELTATFEEVCRESYTD